MKLDGINSEGLMTTHLAATNDEDGYCLKRRYQAGINEMLGVQLLLDTCKEVEEAKKCLRAQNHYVIRIPIHLLVADKYGNSFVWELDEYGNQYFTDNKNASQIITNFELFKYPDHSSYPNKRPGTGTY